MRAGAARELEATYGVDLLKRVEEEGGRLVRGLEAYVGRVRKGKGVGVGGKERWEKVLARVEEKFAEMVDGVVREMREWYVGVREREQGEVRFFVFADIYLIHVSHMRTRI